MTPDQMRDASLLELFSLEAEAQTLVLSAGLLRWSAIRPRLITSSRACARPIRSRARRGLSASMPGSALPM